MPRPLSLMLLALLLMPFPGRLTAAQGGEPSREPVLRVETGMHTARIPRIGVDAANRYLVTASDDKTLRVWELPAGRLLRVIRPPIGDGNQGKLYAVAISPDGQTIAAGGWTSVNGQGESIYIFDRESGMLLKRLEGLPRVVLHLVYSRDGRRLAASLYGKNGVRVYDTRSCGLVGEDRDYGDDSYGADFDAAGRLVTASDDGFVRLYDFKSDGSLRLIVKAKPGGGGHPYSVGFSPDGSRVAVGFDDSPKVDVLSGRDLSALYAPDTRGVGNGDLSKVAWSADGKTLYAGGEYYTADGVCPIRAWADGGRGAYRDLQAAADTIFHILPLRGGGIVYGAGEPSFGVIEASGKRALFVGPATAHYMDNPRGLLLSADGATIRFDYEGSGKSPAQFSVSDRRLETSPGGATGLLRPPVTEAAGLTVADWDATTAPKLNGVPLRLDPYETSRSLAVAPDRQQFLLGAEYYLRLFDKSGAERWAVAAPGTAWAVNVSGDGRLAVAAYGDGTIRWYRMTDGKELLAFFPHADRKRWVLWTPSGYYDASTGAEDLIGWHVNNGPDSAADFFPVGQFRNALYRPDVLAKVLAAGDEGRALKLANDEAGRPQQQEDVARILPPLVTVVSPADGAEVSSTEVTVRFSLRTPSGEPVTEVRALVDGRPAAVERGLSLRTEGQASSAVRALRVAVPEGESQVSVIAVNRFTTSVPATVRVRVRKAPARNSLDGRLSPAPPLAAGSDDTFEIKPKLYVLAVGVSNYADPKLKLSFAAKDARDFVATLEAQKGGLYRDVVVKVLTDEQATKDEVLDGLDWIRRETTSKDVAMILLAGHGINDHNQRYYFLPANTDLERLLRTGVPFEDIKATISSLAGKTLFFIDTCHSGNVIGGRRGLGDIVGVVNELASAENGAVVFAASTGNQYSLENPEWKNGAFTLAVVEGFRGRADYVGKGRITVNMLDLYISERVKELTAGRQTPTTAKPQTVPDFPVALKR